mmetsp:Transcript_3798/g.16097  ORF Transcript_3798/g.16097 Transcript_3798/m.16097 type:complete len:295 (-) Transcript_3798:1555-2439(-)
MAPAGTSPTPGPSASLAISAAAPFASSSGASISGTVNPWSRMSMFCWPSYLNGRLPKICTRSCRCSTSFSNSESANASTLAFSLVTSATVRLYAASTSARTSSSIMRAVSCEYGFWNDWSSVGNESMPTFSFMPYTATRLYAIFVTFSKSFCAPVLIFPSITSSAARPPSVMHIMSVSCCVVASKFSFGRYCANPNAADPRGTMDTFRSGSACSSIHPTTAWPASWYATVSRSTLFTTLFFFSRPAMTRSAACSKCESVTDVAARRAATSAASFTTLAMSAPENPGVSAASRSL